MKTPFSCPFRVLFYEYLTTCFQPPFVKISELAATMEDCLTLDPAPPLFRQKNLKGVT